LSKANSTTQHLYPELTSTLEKSVKLAKAGKKPRLTRAILGVGVECDMDAEGGYVLPADQGALVDLLYRARERRLEMQRETERVERLENQIKNHFIETLSANSTGLAGRVARVQVETKAVPQIEDWDKFYKYVVKHKAFDLLQRRLNEGAAKERLEAGKGAKAGLTVFRAKKISVTKI
jgi:hypothetical protein